MNFTVLFTSYCRATAERNITSNEVRRTFNALETHIWLQVCHNLTSEVLLNSDDILLLYYCTGEHLPLVSCGGSDISFGLTGSR